MNFSIETIRSRNSVRSFDGLPLETGLEEALRRSFRDALPGPFGGRPRFELIGPGMENASGNDRIGTYGVIRDAPAYIVGAVSRGPFAYEDFGYCLEGIILEATALGLGTCWLGGFFDRGDAARALALATDEVIPAVSPVGRASGRRTVMDRAIRGSAGSARRKSFEELFFDGDFRTPLGLESAGAWSELLDCVRAGPSASNKQPWRILRDGGPKHPRFHLFLAEDRAYNRVLGEIRPQNIDMGIAMRHFEAAAHALELPGRWFREETQPFPEPSSFSYISTWSIPH